MVNLELCDKHNMVAYLKKPTGSEGFQEILDFLNGSHIRFALIKNPTIYVSLIKKFWQTAIVRTVDNGEQEITAIVDGKEFTITEVSVRRHLQLADVEGISALPTTEIFDQLSLMGYVLTDDKLTFQKDEAVYVEGDDRVKRATTNAASLYAARASGNITKTQSTVIPNVPLPQGIGTGGSPGCQEAMGGSITQTRSERVPTSPYDSPLSRVNTLGSDEGSMTLLELTVLCTTLSKKVESLEADLKQTKKVYSAAYTKLIKKVMKLEKTVKSNQARSRANIMVSYDEDVGAEADFNNLETTMNVKPKKVTQALTDPSWIEAMQDELLQFRLKKVERLVDLPKRKHAIGTRWVYRNKKDERGIVVRNKARLVAQDHNLWDVIVNGDLEEESAPTGETFALPASKTAKQLAARRNQEREAIKSRFGGNVESKKMKKNVLKHQFENFSPASNENLDKAYNRFQKLISQLEVHGAPISKEDINQKFLRSLPSSWNQIALIMRNKPDIDEIDIDDLYNNLRVYEDELKRSSGSNSASQNLDFLSSENTSSTNKVSTASGDFGVSTAGGINQVPSTPCAHDVAYSFFAQPTTSPQLENEDFQQMDGDDLEELDLRWQVAMLTVRVKKKGHFARECRSGRNQGRRSYGDNGRSNAPTNESSSQALVAQDGLGGYDWSNDFEVEPVNYALMAISSSSSSSSSDSEVQKCSKQCLESFKTLQKNYDTEREKHNKAKLEIRGYEIALESLESRILGHEKNELAWGEKYEFQNYELKCREIKINNLNLELEKVVKERDELKDKIAKWEESTKNLDEILNSQMSARDKTGLGYSTQLNELSSNHETDSENSLSIFDARSSDEENTPENDRFSKNRYKVVPPPITRNFLTPRADISFAGLDEYAIRNKIIESQTTELNTKTSETVGQTNDANTEKPKSASESVMSNPKIDKDRVIIEDWNSDDEEEEYEVQTVRPETQTVKTRDDKSGQNSKKQGIGFRKVKACFVCKSTDHLIKDCNFHDKKSQEPKLKNVVNTGQREGKPVWDNTKRINHQNFSKYPHLSKTFVPSGVLTRTGLHRPSVSTARPSVSTARPVYATRPIYPRMDNVRPRGSCSPIKRSYYTKPAFRPKDLKQDVKTFRVQNMTTAGTRAVVNTGKGKLDTDLKKSRWVWRPKGNYLDHVSKDSGSFMLKKGNPEILLQDHAVVDSGCSSHMTGNKAYLSDYEDFNGGLSIKIHTDSNVADLLTKGFDVTRFNFLVVSIGLLNL
ncbi:ribonuclease H-like domain-containing protein [Tanacetum coccineum]